MRYATVADLATALRERRISAAELAEETLVAIADVAPTYNALAHLLRERAVTSARVADERLTRGDAPALCGIPYGAKDLFAARGGPTTWGAVAFADQVFSYDAEVIQRLERTGAVLAAKLAMSEYAGGGRPAKPGASLHGQGRNPWNPAHYSGGSSSGSGICVALGLVPFALGTETGGSVVGPAAFSGVTGLRPTYGTVPVGGVMTLSWSLDKVGPLARTAEDCAIVMDAIASRPPKHGYQAHLDEVPRSLRVGFSQVELEEAEPGIRRSLSRAVDEMRRLFPDFVQVELDRNPEFISAIEDIVRIEGAYGLREHLVQDDFRMSDDRQLSTLRAGLKVPAAQYIYQAREVTSRARRSFDEVFRQADVILSASRATVAPRLDETRPPRDARKLSDLLRAAANLAGVPGVSIPCGLSDNGLPVGLQIIGPRGSDGRVLGVASAFQSATEYHDLYPPDTRKD